MKNIDHNDLQSAHRTIKAPAGVDLAIRAAIVRAEKSKTSAHYVRRSLLAAAAAFMVLFLSVNAMPGFGSAMENVPGIGVVVRAMRLTNYGIGGAITDGQAVGPIRINQNTITIAFAQDGLPANTAPWFKTSIQEYPHGLLIELGGVRSIFGDGEMPAILRSPFIRDIYRVVTLDDSAQRLMVTFNGPVEVTVTELSAPAALQIKVAKGAATETRPAYAVRTASIPFGETVGVWESMLSEALGRPGEGVRLLQDENGMHLAEAGHFATEELARAQVERLQASGLIDFALHVERRGPTDTPKFIAPK